MTLWIGGLPETVPADFDGYEQVRQWLVGQTLAGHTATLADVGTSPRSPHRSSRAR